MSSNIGNLGCSATEKFSKRHEYVEVMLKYNRKDSEQSFIVAIQLFSDKSFTSLGENDIEFYPVHLTLFNFTEQWLKSYIKNGDNILAYLPVRHADVNQ